MLDESDSQLPEEDDGVGDKGEAVTYLYDNNKY